MLLVNISVLVETSIACIVGDLDHVNFLIKIKYFAVKSLKPNNLIDLNAGKHNQPPDMTRWMEEWLPALAHFTFQ